MSRSKDMSGRGEGRTALSPELARTLRRSRLHARLLALFGVMFLALGLVLVGAAKHQRDELPPGGIRLRGRVVSVEVHGGHGVANIQYESVGRVRTTTARWDDSRDRYVKGESVEVAVDPTDADHVVVLPSRPASYALFVEILVPLVGLVALVTAGVLRVRVRRQRRGLLQSALPHAAARPPADPVVALVPGALVAVDPTRTDEGPWFREARRNPAATSLRLVLPSVFVLAGLARTAVTREPASVLIVPFVVLAVVLGPILFLPSRTVTTVDRDGLHQRIRAGARTTVSFEHIAAVERSTTIGSSEPTRIVVTADDGTKVAVVTRRPDELLAALRRGRVLV